MHAHQRPKLERYDDTLFTVFKHPLRRARRLTATSEVVETGEVMCLHRPALRHHRPARRPRLAARRCGTGSRSDPELLAKGPSAVLHAIADHVVDGYTRGRRAAGRHRRGRDRGLLRRAGSRATRRERIYQLKREVLEFKRAVSPLLRPMQLLSERPMRLIDPDIQKYFRDVADHLARVARAGRAASTSC